MREDSKLEEKERLRNAVINELVNTERDYVKDLAYILEEFKDPLESKDLLSPVCSSLQLAGSTWLGFLGFFGLAWLGS